MDRHLAPHSRLTVQFIFSSLHLTGVTLEEALCAFILKQTSHKLSNGATAPSAGRLKAWDFSAVCIVVPPSVLKRQNAETCLRSNLAVDPLLLWFFCGLQASCSRETSERRGRDSWKRQIRSVCFQLINLQPEACSLNKGLV